MLHFLINVFSVNRSSRLLLERYHPRRVGGAAGGARSGGAPRRLDLREAGHRERLLAAKLAGLDAHRLNLFRCGERPARAALLLVLHRGGEVASPIVRGGGVETLRLELVAVRWEAEGDDGRKER